MKNLVAFVCGLLFSIGAGLSGMVRPSKVTGFLDFTSNWDPSLMFVMVGALTIMGITWRIVRGLKTPLIDGQFPTSPSSKLDSSLLGGAALFGIGWGLGGFCPGPAITSVFTGSSCAIFLVSMLAGMALHKLLTQKTIVGESSDETGLVTPASSSELL